MNEFDYIIKLEEMSKLKTKTSKMNFIRVINRELKSYTSNPTYYTFRLAQDTYAKFFDQNIVGISSLYTNLSTALGRLCWNTLRTPGLPDIDPKIFELELILENSMPYNVTADFLNTSGVPAYLKMVMLKEKYRLETNKEASNVNKK